MIPVTRTRADDSVDYFAFGPLRLEPATLAQTVDWIADRARYRERALVVTPNINHLWLAGQDPAFGDLLRSADRCTADGWPLVMASRLLGCPLPERVAGIDLVQRLLLEHSGFRVAILGGPKTAAPRLARRLNSRHEIALVDELPVGRWDNETQRVRLYQNFERASATLTLIGIGAPRQEWLARDLLPIASGPIICCGAAIEVLAGVVPRAPAILRRLGLEWAFRLAREPRRLVKRYVLGSSFYLRTLAQEGRRALSPARD